MSICFKLLRAKVLAGTSLTIGYLVDDLTRRQDESSTCSGHSISASLGGLPQLTLRDLPQLHSSEACPQLNFSGSPSWAFKMRVRAEPTAHAQSLPCVQRCAARPPRATCSGGRQHLSSASLRALHVC